MEISSNILQLFIAMPISRAKSSRVCNISVIAEDQREDRLWPPLSRWLLRRGKWETPHKNLPIHVYRMNPFFLDFRFNLMLEPGGQFYGPYSTLPTTILC